MGCVDKVKAVKVQRAGERTQQKTSFVKEWQVVSPQWEAVIESWGGAEVRNQKLESS